jgi:hypothetical protein
MEVFNAMEEMQLAESRRVQYNHRETSFVVGCRPPVPTQHGGWKWTTAGEAETAQRSSLLRAQPRRTQSTCCAAQTLLSAERSGTPLSGM